MITPAPLSDSGGTGPDNGDVRARWPGWLRRADPAVLAGAVAGSAVVAGGAGAVGEALRGGGAALLSSELWPSVVLVLSYALAGLLLAVHLPRHPVGWLFLAVGWTGALALAARLDPDSTVGLVIGKSAWLVPLGFVPLALLRFPGGGPPAGRWAVVDRLAWAGLVLGGAGLLATAALAPTALFETGRPLPAAAWITFTVATVGLALTFVSAVAAVVHLGTRARHETGTVRAQLLCMAAAAVVAGAAMVADGLGVSGIAAFGAVALPVAATVSIVRFDWYDLGPFVNRTVTLVALAAYVTLWYGLGAGLVQRWSAGADVGRLWPLATAVVLVTAQPLARWVSTGVNRLLYGERDRPYAAMARLGERLEAVAGPGEMLPAIAGAIREALQLPYTAIETDGDDARLPTAEVGERGRDAEVIPLYHHGVEVGRLRVRPREVAGGFGRQDRRLLADFARVAAIAVYCGRLTLEVQDSRDRTVRSRDDERRRLRHDLHDGLGPMLSGVRLGLEGLAAGRMANDATGTRLRRLASQLDTATAEVRRLIDGLRPSPLDDTDLVGALRRAASGWNELVADGGFTVEVSAVPDLGDLPSSVEDVAYRVAVEAVHNAIRHARAHRCVIRVERTPALRLVVDDDGVGIAENATPGVGIRSMRARATELDGTLRVARRVVAGTRVELIVPL